MGDGENKAMVAAFYERLPIFCFTCGKIGHAAIACSRISSDTTPDVCAGEMALGVSQSAGEHDMQVDGARHSKDSENSSFPDKPQETWLEKAVDSETGFGPWLVVQRHRGRGYGRGP